MSAQASRNRDLEQQLQSLRISSGSAQAGDNEDDTLMLHEEVGDDFLNMNAPAGGVTGGGGCAAGSAVLGGRNAKTSSPSLLSSSISSSSSSSR